MTIKSSGSLKMSEINAELGRSNTATNLGLAALRTLAGKPSGSIKFSDFYGKSHEVSVTLGAANSIVLEASFTGEVWASATPKRVIIPSGVTIGATTSYAIATSYTANGQAGNFGGTLTLENRGTVSGIGGAANSGVGGNAILTSFLGRDGNKLTIQNYGTIRAGGGGGGRGGTGGAGQAQTNVSGYAINWYSPVTWWSLVTGGGLYVVWNGTTIHNAYLPNQASLTTLTVGGWVYQRGTLQPSDGGQYYSVRRYQWTTTSGGAGGNGGRGQGFDGAAATGANGAAGGTNAGAGGKGGSGGGWGASGTTGSTGANGNVSNGAAGSTGGLAGFYITAGANVTLVNTGTVQGRIG